MSILAITRLNSIEVLISKALIDSYISHKEFISLNNVLKVYDEIKEKSKILIKSMFDVIEKTTI